MELLHFTIWRRLFTRFSPKIFSHVARAALQFRVETFESQLSTRLAAGRQNASLLLLLLLLWLAVSNWNGEADEDGASTRWSEANERANERANELPVGRTLRARLSRLAQRAGKRVSHTIKRAHTHTRKHAIVLCVCGSGCCLSCLCALSLPLSLSFSLSHLPELVIELEPYSSLLDLLFRYLCVCTMRVCVRVCLSVLVSLS